MQQCEPFAGNRNVIKAHAGHVAARPTDTGHERLGLRIATGHENNRNACRSCLRRPRGWNAASDNRSHRKGDQFTGKFRQLLVSTIPPTRFDYNFVTRIA